MKYSTSVVEIDTTRQVTETDDELIIPAILARAGVLQYPDGRAFRSPDELEKSTENFATWVTVEKHPPEKLMRRRSEIQGKVLNPTYDATIKGTRGDVHIKKALVSPQTLKDLKELNKRELSVGLTFDQDFTPGTYEGKPYDYIQKDILVNHVAVGVQGARVKPPLVGLCVDIDEQPTSKAVTDMWEDTENSIRSGHGNAADAESCRTTDFDGKLPKGIQAVYCKKKGSEDWYIQSYIFSKDAGWTMEKAKSWFEGHNDAITEAERQFAKIACDITEKPKSPQKKPLSPEEVLKRADDAIKLHGELNFEEMESR